MNEEKKPGFIIVDRSGNPIGEMDWQPIDEECGHLRRALREAARVGCIHPSDADTWNLMQSDRGWAYAMNLKTITTAIESLVEKVRS